MKAIVIGASAGGLNALQALISGLPAELPVPVFIVQHSSSSGEHLLPVLLQEVTKMHVFEAEDKTEILPGCCYVAPPNYHLMVENMDYLSLSTDAKVNYSRPSIDVLFESAARVYREELTGIILTGANSDGAKGIVTIAELGGLTIAQDPEKAEFPFMPQSAINTGRIKLVLSPEMIIAKIIELTGDKVINRHKTNDTTKNTYCR